jgi:ribulose-5-phosphate 4-epimerase/fuculose-1-phosphate aldolase
VPEDAGPDVSTAEFRSAGRALFSFGLVKGAEGDLSTFDGTIMAITRAGASLADLTGRDVVTGGVDGQFPGASTDLEVHRQLYRRRGPGAIAHAHPPGTVPDDAGDPGEHGVYVFAASLAMAVEAAIEEARTVGRVQDGSR